MPEDLSIGLLETHPGRPTTLDLVKDFGVKRVGTGPDLLAWIKESEDGRPILALKGVLDKQSGPVVAEAWQRVAAKAARGITLDLSAVRRWDAPGLAKFLEFAAGTPRVSVVCEDPRLTRALAEVEPGWVFPGGPSEPANGAGPPWNRWVFDTIGQTADILLATFLLLAIAPILALLALAIALDSKGPVLYTQPRAGRMRRDGSMRVFRVYKFRTMVADADAQRAALIAAHADGPFFKLKRDPRVTRVGHWLRATSLDELPQLFNVVRGDMRLVGNRPLALDEADLLKEPWQRTRFSAPAGLTGLWQVSGRNEASARARMALDTAYAVARTPLLDVKIMLATVPVVLNRKGW